MLNREERRGVWWVGLFLVGLIASVVGLLVHGGRADPTPVRASAPSLALGTTNVRVVHALTGEVFASPTLAIVDAGGRADPWIEPDAEGHRLGGLPLHVPLQLRVHVDDFEAVERPFRLSEPDAPPLPDVVLRPLRSLAGTVVDSSGRAVEGAEVVLTLASGVEHARTVSGLRGTFAISPRLPASRAALTATLDVAETRATCVVDATDADLRDLVLELAPAPRWRANGASRAAARPSLSMDEPEGTRRYTGQLLDHEDRPIACATVVLFQEDGPRWAMTGPDGAFTVRLSQALSAKPAWLERPGGGIFTTPHADTPAPWRWPSSRDVRIEVQDESAAGLSGVVCRWGGRERVTGADGRTVFRHLPVDEEIDDLIVAAGPHRVVTLQSDSSVHQLRLYRPRTLTVSVTDSEGRALDAELAVTFSDVYSHLPVASATTTDATATLIDLPPPPWRLRCQAGDVTWDVDITEEVPAVTCVAPVE